MTNHRSLPASISAHGDRGQFPTEIIVCPYCDTKGKFKLGKEQHRDEGSGRFSSATWLFLNCQVCNNVVFVIYGMSSSENYGLGSNTFDYVQFPRQSGQITGHESWPANSSRYLVQAKQALKSQSWDAAAVMARSALQVVLREKGAAGKSLAAETNDLVQKGLLVASMAEWAKEIREGGNEAAHPSHDSSGVTEEDARQIVEFTEYLLHYLYVIPSQIESRRQRLKK